MSRFPRSEPEIAALALAVTQGLTQASDEFPAAREQHAAKDDALEQLVDGVKANLKYAEIAVRDQPEKLSQVGWGVPVRGSALEAPGEVRDIAIRAEGETWVVLDWKAPVDGGTIAAYKIQRRNDDSSGSWELADTSVETEHMLNNQPRGVALEYRVTAVNRAGSGKPSATVTLVL